MSTIQRASSVRVGPALAGRGVFAAQTFDADVTVGMLRGRFFDDPNYGSDYCIGLFGDLSLEPAAPFRYLNHSCEPNCAVYWSEEDREAGRPPRVWLESLRPIDEGEELTIDYAWDSQVECRCGASSCRGWIVARPDA